MKMVKINLHQHNNEVGDMNIKSEIKSPQKRKCKCGILPLLLSGTTLITLGFLSIKVTFFDLILLSRLEMQPGFPPYDLWLNPKPEVRLSVYIFTVENVNEFLNGIDSKIKLKEIGPIIYREYLRHTDVVFHENSTLTYTAVRWAEFLPHANEPGILNKTITVPNFAILAAAGYMNDANIFVKMGYNVLHSRSDEEVFMNISIYNFLWNYKSPLLQTAKDIVPFMVPTVNSGILHGVYKSFTDRYNVRIGSKYGDSQFFLINSINGGPTVPGYDIKKGDCYASVENSTEGAMYRQRLTKDTVLWFWRKALCRTVALYYEKEVQMGQISAYKYTLRSDMYDRLPNKTSDCYRGTYEELQDGLTDVSKCYFNMPFAASIPHFYGRHEHFTNKFEGLNPNEVNHTSYTIVEPTIGIPLAQSAKSQMNLVIPKLNGFAREYQLFSNMILPLFWVEYSQKDLTPDILSMVTFAVKILPIIQHIVTFVLISVGFGLVVVGVVNFITSKWYLRNISGKSQQPHPDLLLKTIKLDRNAGIFEKNSDEF